MAKMRRMTSLPVAVPDSLDQPQDPLLTLRRAIAQLDQQRHDLAAAGNLHTLAAGLAQLRALTGDLRQLAQHVEDDVAALMPDKQVEIPGVGVIERRKGTDRRKWQSEDLLRTLIRDEIDPDGTGELPDAGTVLQSVMTVVTECVPITGSLGWRVTKLRERGIDPDEWAECTPGRVTVQIHDDLKGA